MQLNETDVYTNTDVTYVLRVVAKYRGISKYRGDSTSVICFSVLDELCEISSSSIVHVTLFLSSPSFSFNGPVHFLAVSQ